MARSRQRRDLTAAEVVERAAAVLRDEGEAALTMRRVADECGVTPMALYHHVSDKDDLVRLVVDDLVGTGLAAAPEPAGDWRDAMIDYAVVLRAAFMSNPGAAAVFVRRPITGPNMAMVTERFFEIADLGGLRGEAAARAVDAVVLLMIGSVANDLTRPPAVREQLLDYRPAEDTPAMARDMQAYAHRDPEQRFRAALRWLVDGIERDRSAAGESTAT